jgi:hypothetical protein
VGVAQGHPLFGKDYNDVAVSVHGGLTYAAACGDGPEAGSICHIPGKGEPNHVWWFGFDAGHAFDEAPAMSARFRNLCPGTYRDWVYMENEVKALAKQLAEPYIRQE